ncbi:MAG: GNAT family N-acetyltransferase [Firmicutes bacterium]|nr:GNAT family N-acetyltransferase [Bacillota bacterium]
MKYRIRRAKRQDVKKVAALAVEAVEASISKMRDVPLEEVRRFRKKDLDSLHETLNNNAIGIFIAENIEDNEFLGHVIVMSGYLESSTGEEQGYIFDLSIKPQYRRLGIGKHLMKTAEDFCKAGGMKYMALNVTASNDSAVDFYENLGYETERRRMMKRLDKTGGNDADIRIQK